MAKREMPVAEFDPAGNHRIVGFLEFEEFAIPRSHETFRIKPTEPWPTLAQWQPRDLCHNRLDEVALQPRAEWIQLERSVMGARRSGTDVWYCDVFLTRDVDKLPRLAGFVWFAEKFGKLNQLNRVPARG